MRRIIALIIVALVLAPGTWLRTPPEKPVDELTLGFAPLDPAGLGGRDGGLGPFKIQGVWRIDSRHRRFGSYSALIAPGHGQLLAFSDQGVAIRFSPPGASPSEPADKQLFKANGVWKAGRDIEAATFDPVSRRVWLGMEFRNAVSRYDLRDRLPVFDTMVQPAALSDWGTNSGPESLVRLRDGRFVALREGFSTTSDRRRHPAALFAGDPVEKPDGIRFTYLGPDGFSPTDIAQLPDGRVLVLFRRVLWPFPARFAGGLAIGDPDAIRAGRDWPVTELVRWAGGVPVDNFEGIAIEPADKGRVTIWLISDDNRSALQRTILVKLLLDPAAVPDTRKKARGKSARPAK